MAEETEKVHTEERDEEAVESPLEPPDPLPIHHPKPLERAHSMPNEKSDLTLSADNSHITKPMTRKSTQLTRRNGDINATPRASMQLARPHKSSRDFDVRLDGPFGRPSLNMTRRQSSGLAMPAIEQYPSRDEYGNEIAPDPATLEAVIDGDEPGVVYEPEPPPLNYSLWDRKKFIVFFWTMILIDVVAQPIGLYFGLWYGTNLGPNTVFSIITACLGGVSILEYCLRAWKLWKKGSDCRVIGAPDKRYYFDWFHWNFSVGGFIIILELVIGTIPDNPPIRVLSMPLASMLFVFGTELIIVDTLRFFRLPAPVRISSIPQGAQLRPAIYSIIEDVVAVDGNGKTIYREALNRRYEASHVFRAMLRRLGAFWAFGAEAMAIATTTLIWTLSGEVAFVIGWSAPFVWAGVWVAITIWYVRKKLREEKKAWAIELAEQRGVLVATAESQASQEAGSK